MVETRVVLETLLHPLTLTPYPQREVKHTQNDPDPGAAARVEAGSDQHPRQAGTTTVQAPKQPVGGHRSWFGACTCSFLSQEFVPDSTAELGTWIPAQSHTSPSVLVYKEEENAE